jgi:hypothetical protein
MAVRTRIQFLQAHIIYRAGLIAQDAALRVWGGVAQAWLRCVFQLLLIRAAKCCLQTMRTGFDKHAPSGRKRPCGRIVRDGALERQGSIARLQCDLCH